MRISDWSSDVCSSDLCADALGVSYETIPIEPAVQAFGGMLAPAFNGRDPDITEENLQSRVRGVTLMALSNKFGHMVLTTGNKSAMSVGYATLQDRKSVVEGKRVSGGVDLGGRRN